MPDIQLTDLERLSPDQRRAWLREIPDGVMLGIPTHGLILCAVCYPWVMAIDPAPDAPRPTMIRTMTPETPHVCHGEVVGLHNEVVRCNCQGRGFGHEDH